MNLSNIVINNIRRRKNKVAFLLIGLIISTATAVSLLVLGRAMTEDITRRLDEFGANMAVVPATEGLTLSYGGITVSGVNSQGRHMRESDLENLKKIKNAANLSIIAPKLAGQTSINGTTALIAGVRMPDEFRLKKWWALAEGRKPSAPEEIILGSQIAHTLNLKADSVARLGETDVVVSGVLGEMGNQDDGMIFADLAFTQKLLGKPGDISLIEMAALCSDCPIEEMVKQVTAALPGTRVKAMKESLSLKMSAMKQFHSFAFGVSVIIMLVAGMIVLTTMMSSVGERKKEIGLFRAVGYRRSHIMQIVLMEAGLMGIFGGLFGYVVGSIVPRYAAPYLMHANELTFHIDPFVGMVAIVASAGIALLSGVYPAVKAAGLDPAEALRDF